MTIMLRKRNESTHSAIGHPSNDGHQSSAREFGRQSEERGIDDAVDARAT